MGKQLKNLHAIRTTNITIKYKLFILIIDYILLKKKLFK